MKVLMTADAVGGVWNYALELCRALGRHGVEVTLATMGPRPGRPQLDDARACRNLRLVQSDFSLEWMADPWQDVAAAGAWLQELAARVQPDVLHINGYAHAALDIPAPRVVVAHSCVCSWWRAVHGRDAPAEWDRYRQHVRRGVHAADAVVAPTRAMLAELGALYGMPRNGRVIPNGMDMDMLPLGARDAFGRYGRERKLPGTMVLAAGRLWDPAKNMDTLARAAARIRVPVHVAGSATGPGGASHPLHGLHHLGALSSGALRHWMGRASVFVHPALYEPFGLAPLEAARARTALVLSDLPSLREVWGDTATYFPAREVEALADAVNRLIDDPLLMRNRAEAAWRRARAMTGRAMGAAYHALYRELQTDARAGTTATAPATTETTEP
ncbi:MAG TPA: glycosyltransferase [Longimicrobiales bacterium]|nr:glycosyltransferase [Longimicrobiales bacterium]